MKSINLMMLGFSLLAVICIMGIGIAIAENSIWIAITSVVVLILTMGLGFSTRKKLREQGKL